MRRLQSEEERQVMNDLLILQSYTREADGVLTVADNAVTTVNAPSTGYRYAEIDSNAKIWVEVGDATNAPTTPDGASPKVQANTNRFFQLPANSNAGTTDIPQIKLKSASGNSTVAVVWWR